MTASLLEHWRWTVKQAPATPALVDAETGRSWTRAELAAAGDAWRDAHGGNISGQIVVFAAPNGAEWLRVFLGLLSSGATVAALDPGEPPDAQRTMAKSIRAAFLWHGGTLEPIDRGSRVPSPRLAQARSSSPVRQIRQSNLLGYSIAGIVTAGKTATQGGAAVARALVENGAGVIKLTSGSTGTPRAVHFTDAQMLADGRQVCASMDIRPADVNLGCIPFGHSYGLGNLVLPLLVQGTAIVSGAPALPQALAAAIARWRPTVFPAVPALLRGIVEADIDAQQLESLRTVISAGAPLDPEIARAFHRKFSRKIHSFYGSSETGGITFDRTGDAALSGRSVGMPLDGVRLRFGPGRRFWVESAAVAGRGSFRPADRGEVNELGELVLLGRTGRMLKIAGRRLDPAEVERALRALPGVEDAFVEAHSVRSDTLVAAIASRQPPIAWREALRVRVASWKIPRRLVVLPEFPLTPRGKTDTRQLRALLHAEPPRRSIPADSANSEPTK